MKHMTCIEDLRQVARRRVPRAFFDYAEAGSYPQETLRANRADLEKIELRQRVLVDVSGRDTARRCSARKCRCRWLCRRCHERPNAWQRRDCRLPRRAGRRHSLTLSTMSICSIEDVAAAVDKPFWFQLYVMRDRGFVRALIERAMAAKCSALVLTVDLQVLGQRHASA